MPVKYNTDEIRSRASGSWPGIIATCGGISTESLDGHHHPCPKCGGTDRFRMLDLAAGAVFCNQCFNTKNGDGIAAIQWLAGLSFEESCQKVCDYLGITAHDTPSPSRGRQKKPSQTFSTPIEAFTEHSSILRMGKMVDHWEYKDKNGKLVGAVGRWHTEDPSGNIVKKEYRPISLRSDGKWSCDAMPSPRPLYRVDEILAFDEVAVCEGEKAAKAAVFFGYAGTTCAGGAQAVRAADWSALGGKRVLIFPDNDASGESYADEVTKHVLNLKTPARDVRIIRMSDILPANVKASDLPEKWDLADFQNAVVNKPEDERTDFKQRVVARIASAIERATVITKAEKPKSRKQDPSVSNWGTLDDRVCNYEMEETHGDDGPEFKCVPISVNRIAENAERLTDGWPCRVGKALFIESHDDDKSAAWNKKTAVWLKGQDQLFAYYNRKIEQPPDFKVLSGFCTKGEFFADRTIMSREYLAVESLPHEPLLPHHYYLCGMVASGSGNHLRELIDRCRPEEPADKNLILAAFLTPFWGGRGGSRPAFCITAKDDLRGSGKSTLVDMIAAVAGGLIDISDKEETEVMKARLLSPEASGKRIIRFDNIKTHMLSWAELESLITSPIISGKQMYYGESQRPNTLTYYLTMNGVDLSTDMAQRCVIISVVKHPDPQNWKDETMSFIEKNQQEIIADILAILRSRPSELDGSSRWGDWERDVLAKTPDPIESQKLIRKRMLASDVGNEESDFIESYFRQQLEKLGYEFDTIVFIPSRIAAIWYSAATREPASVARASRALKQRASESGMKYIRVCTNRRHGRGFYYWADGLLADQSGVDFDLQNKIDNMSGAADTPKLW